jgi:hypothetical protein
MISRFSVAALLLACTAAVPASAVPLSVTISGLFDGTINGQAYTDAPSSFVGIFDFDPANPVYSGFIPLTSLTATYGGTSYAVSTPSVFVFLTDSFGFGNIDMPYALFSLPTDNPAVAPAAVTYVNGGGPFEISLGTVEITDVTDATVSFGSLGAVPEPATWGMMALGFGMIGVGLRGRRGRAAARA